MLDEIRARNLGLIADATLTPGSGLTVITGETGTGKTLMLGALRLVRGDTASKGMVGPHGDTAEVATRLIPRRGDETVVRRVVTRSKSRAYINGTPATAKELTAVVSPSISIVGQHDQHTLATSDGIRRLVDGMLTRQDRAVLKRYVNAYRDLRAVEAEIAVLGPDARGLQRELEMTRFQCAEIEEAGFEDGDDEALRMRLDRLRHAEEITEELAIAAAALSESGIGHAIGQALSALERVTRIDPQATPMASRLSDVASDANEVAREVSRYAASVDRDPAALAADEQRLSELSALKRKYGDTISDINAFAKNARERSEAIVALLDAAQSLGQRHAGAIDALDAVARELRAARVEHALSASQSAIDHLRDLGFDSPVIRIEVEAKTPTSTGADRFNVLFASDAALSPGPISSIASGGELSRVVLALTLASGGADADVVAFDEIDAGLGGLTALAMGEKLAALARTRQVICVTHLPQVAAYGERHYRIVRNGTMATIDDLDGPPRVEEISRMLAGIEESEKGKSHAEELLALAAATSGADE